MDTSYMYHNNYYSLRMVLNGNSGYLFVWGKVHIQPKGLDSELVIGDTVWHSGLIKTYWWCGWVWHSDSGLVIGDTVWYSIPIQILLAVWVGVRAIDAIHFQKHRIKQMRIEGNR